MPELLFEIGCEELPADDLQVLPAEFARQAENALKESRLEPTSIESFATPRRLILFAQIVARQTDLRERRIGPPKKAAVDEAGNPTKAGLGFAASTGVPFHKLKTTATERGEYLSAEIVMRGRPAAIVLKECLPRVVSKLPFKKFMKWEDDGFLFGRPIRSILLLLDGKPLPLTLAGVKAGKHTFGHRFLGSKKIAVSSYQQYQDELGQNGVVLKFEDRMEKIERELHEHAKGISGQLKEDPELLRTMANEVEYPEVLTGSFSSEFLALPQDVLINAMRKHQKYFCGLDANGGLLPAFFTVLNTRASRPELIRRGHERVLHARLHDAAFFWNEDRKQTLQSRVPQLERLTYHVKLGSYSERVARISRIAEAITEQLQLAEIRDSLLALIPPAKADLVTLMVGEFPELQGKMAGLYAREEGYPDEQWQALYDQYLPVSAEDSVPRNLLGALISAADRVEALAAGFTLNMIPTGSRDPYALRRVAGGLMKILLEYGLDLDLGRLFDQSLSLFQMKAKQSREELLAGLADLMYARFRFYMEQKGIPHDYLNAVSNAEKRSFIAAFSKLNALWSKNQSEDLKTLARAFKRINNIIHNHPNFPFDGELLQEDGEMRLHRAFTDLEFRVRQNIDVKDYSDALDIMVTLGPEIDNFFDEVLVMAENESLKRNRIALLQRISELYRKLADFSALQIDLTANRSSVPTTSI